MLCCASQVVKLHALLMLICLLCLQSCQYLPGIDVDNKELSEAASYNTQLGLAYLKQGNMERAKHKLLVAMSQAPNSATVNAAMGYFMEKSVELKKAQYYYKRSLALAPKSGAQLNNYGAFLCRIGKYKQADTYFLKAINDIKYEHTAGTYENAGLCAMANHQVDKAAAYFVKALRLDPSRAQSLCELKNIKYHQSLLAKKSGTK